MGRFELTLYMILLSIMGICYGMGDLIGILNFGIILIWVSIMFSRDYVIKEINYEGH